MGNKCIPDICGIGFYEDYNEIQKLGGFDLHTDMQKYLELLKTQISLICIKCPDNCTLCSVKGCIICATPLFLDIEENKCV